MKITCVFFSATGNTKKSSLAIAEGIKGDADELAVVDVTNRYDGECLEFTKDDVLVIGGPVYGGRIPIVALERLKLIKGDNTPCIVVASYGNRHYDDALIELSDMVTERGFVVVGGAAVVGRHTYGEIAIERPDADDIEECKQFGARVRKKILESATNINLPGNRPYKEGANKGSFRPETKDHCTQCGLCASKCPVQAIGGDCETISDKCISCFRCIRSCPVGAKVMEADGYINFVRDFNERLKNRRENEFFD